MQLLAISTSGPTASVALWADGALDCRMGGKGTHSQTLAPLIDELLSAHGLSPRDIDLYAADMGPGSFTGVRMGVCTANALAAACRKKVVGVSSLHALCFGRPGRICALLDARNGNGYAAVYENDACILPPQAVEVEPFLCTVSGPTVFIGDGADAYYDAISRYVCKYSVIPGATPGAAAVACAAFALYQNGEARDAILPLYLRPSQAERLYKEK